MDNRFQYSVPVLDSTVVLLCLWDESEPGSGREGNYPCLSAVGVDEEERNVGELERRAGAVDGGDEQTAIGDPGEPIPEADEAVEQGEQVGEPIELLRGFGFKDSLEGGPENATT